jgi:NAD(P)-dependent dehydrogenase (short-subunit alcohol dehydrogenase family)
MTSSGSAAPSGTVIVTGAAGFIGNAIVERLLAEGRNVIGLDHNFGDAPLGQPLDKMPGCLRRTLDVSAEDDWRVFAAEQAGQADAVTGLVTVAAINRVGPIADYDCADWDAMMAVNVRGVFLAAKHVVPLMQAAGGGAIVNMSSVSAFIGARGGAAYHATKGAVLSLSRALALELADDGIRVNSVCPGWVDTPFTDRYLATLPDPTAARAKAERLHALGRFASPADVAGAVSYLLSSSASFVTGTELIVDGGFMIRKE